MVYAVHVPRTLNRGFVVNHKRVQRLMHSMGPQEALKEKYHSTKGKSVSSRKYHQ